MGDAMPKGKIRVFVGFILMIDLGYVEVQKIIFLLMEGEGW